MYVPNPFEETSVEAMRDLMHTYPLATLVTVNSGELNANHIPLYWTAGPEPWGTLRGHVARANPLLIDLDRTIESLAVFQGPNTYITPSWYATKQKDGKVVPTWNYAVVHAYGFLRVIEDASWIRTQLEIMTAHHESSFPKPWAVSDAPVDFTEKLIGAVVGVEMVVTRLLGKWKVSQNQSAINRAGVIEGLNSNGQADALPMVDLIEKAARNIS